MLSVNVYADCVEGADGFAYAAVCALLWVYVENWASGFLSLLFGLFFDVYGFSGADGFADFAADACCLVHCEFVVFGIEAAFDG